MIKILHDAISNREPIMLYGAGKNARSQIGKLSEVFTIKGIWDRGSSASDIEGYKIYKPFENERAEVPQITIITIKDERIRVKAAEQIYSKGCKYVLFSDEVIRVLEETRNLYASSKNKSCNLVDFWKSDIPDLYKYINSVYAPINYSVVCRDNDVFGRDEVYKPEVVSLTERINEVLIENSSYEEVIKDFISSTENADGFHFLIYYELFLRRLLCKGVKTKERPIRMVGDETYDDFAVYETQKCTILAICRDDLEKALKFTEKLLRVSYFDKYLIVVKMYLLFELGRFQESLELGRSLQQSYATDFLINEVFYEIAVKCRDLGVAVKEALPSVDLTKRFCWSGLSFEWIGGFDKAGKAITAPCFRAIECAARPKGDFATSEEWKLFRESIVDGSFRYCQKNQCTNIVGGWLPEKSKTDDDTALSVIAGNYEVPSPREIHLSYDRHCNLMCPSCRTERCLYSDSEIKRFDNCFKSEVLPMLRKAEHLCLSGSGEALLSPHSRSILMNLPELGNNNLIVELRTNMTAMNEKTWESLGEGRRYIRHVAASIDSCTKDLFEKLRYPARWDTVVENLDFVRKLRENNEIAMFEFHVVIQEANVNELTEIAEMAISYGADAVTYSKIVNWRGMSNEEYFIKNPFFTDNEKHTELISEISRLKQLRESIQTGQRKIGKPFFINIHFEPDPPEGYDTIRYGRIKIR